MKLGEWLSAKLDRSVGRRIEKERFRAGFPRDGFADGRMITPLVDRLTDEQLDALNGLLEWNCFTVDSRGRRFGWPANKDKRDVPETIPDPRIVKMHERFDLTGKRVLEVGCF